MQKKSEVPTWALRSIQGITYWIGHRRSLYDQYPIGEAAFIAEICNLIYAHLDRKNYVLRCEVQYKDLAGNRKLPGVFGERARADIVVCTKPSAKNALGTPKFIIEVKRGLAPKSEIDNDLRRLAEIARLTTGSRTMLIVVSEAKLPGRFVNAETGKSKGGAHSIPDDQGHFFVRRTAKAAHSFSKFKLAQYASLLEVFPWEAPGRRTGPKVVKKASK